MSGRMIDRGPSLARILPLKARRKAAGIPAAAIAREMGVTLSCVVRHELAQDCTSELYAARYSEAITRVAEARARAAGLKVVRQP